MPKKLTHEEYVNRVKEINPNIEVLGTYVNNRTKILHRCKIDGYEWMVTPDGILLGRGCPRCAGNERCGHEGYIKKVAAINPNIEVVGTYVNNHTSILHRCKIDNYEWYVAPSSILLGYGCPRCSKHEVYGHDEYVKRVAKINPNIEVIGKYTDSQTKILHKCKIDGYEWFATPSKILYGKGCPKCAGSMLKTHEEYIEELKIKNPSIIAIGRYINHITKIRHKCLIHNYEWETTPSDILSGRGCPMCRGEKIRDKLVKSHDEYVNELSIVNKNIIVLEKYINARTKIKHKCLICGLEWDACPDSLLHDGGCPNCKNKSIGEKKISIWLDNNNIQYEKQKVFIDCRDKHPLPFDFYLQNYNILIEYNGIQHYEPVEYFGGKEKFESQVKRDNIKKEYCKKNNISLFEIPYYSDLDEELKRLYNFIKIKDIEKEVKDIEKEVIV